MAAPDRLALARILKSGVFVNFSAIYKVWILRIGGR
jgi:hypothetical protein